MSWSTFNISDAVYDNKSFNISTQTTGSRGFFLKDNGLKLYVIGGVYVYQYTLSTAWDISTASYDGVSFSVNSQTNSPQSFCFKSDGTAMYVIGGTTTYQYTLSTAWDISTASYASKSITLSSFNNGCYNILWNSNGTKFYGCVNADKNIYQFSASTAWDISTVTFDGTTLNTTGVNSSPRGFSFNDTGTKLWIVNVVNNYIYQYTLSTAWNLNTASYNSNSYNTSTQLTSDLAYLFFKTSDGSKFYANAVNGSYIYQYTTYTPALGPANLKSYNSNLKSNIKSINGNLIANCKSLDTNA